MVVILSAKRETRDDRTDVISFWYPKESNVTTNNYTGVGYVNEKVDETTETELNEKKIKLEADLLLVNQKLQLIADLD